MGTIISGQLNCIILNLWQRYAAGKIKIQAPLPGLLFQKTGLYTQAKNRRIQ